MVRRNALKKLMTLASKINFVSKILMGKHFYGEKYKFTLDHPIFVSNILLLQSVGEVHNAWKQKRDINYFECLEEFKICIRYTYEYFDVADSV